jgi:hypothetical protein
MGHDSFPCLGVWPARKERQGRLLSANRGHSAAGTTRLVATTEPLTAAKPLPTSVCSCLGAEQREKGFRGRSTQSPAGLLRRHPAADWIVAFCFCRADVTYHRRVCPGSSLGFLTPTRPTRPFLADRTWAFSLLTLCRASGCSACSFAASRKTEERPQAAVVLRKARAASPGINHVGRVGKFAKYHQTNFFPFWRRFGFANRGSEGGGNPVGSCEAPERKHGSIGPLPWPTHKPNPLRRSTRECRI